MIRFRLAELIADAQFKAGRRVTLVDVAEGTGINRITLSRMSNVRGYSTSTDTIDKLCRYFGCDIADVAQYLDDDAVPPAGGTPAPAAAPPAAPPAPAPAARKAARKTAHRAVPPAAKRRSPGKA